MSIKKISKRDKNIFIGTAVMAIVIGVLVFVSGKAYLPDTQIATEGLNRSAAATVPFTRLVQGTRSKVSERINYIINSPEQMKELWNIIDAPGTPPTVDFNTQAVLAVFAGNEPNVGINIAKIEDSSSRTVLIAIAKPEGACAKKALTTSPYELVVVPASPLPLAHEDISTTVICPK